jgi:hypothetical protein
MPKLWLEEQLSPQPNGPPEQPAEYREEERYLEIVEVENFIERRASLVLFRHFLDDFDDSIWVDGVDAKQRV